MNKLETKVNNLSQVEDKANIELNIIEELSEREKRATNVILFGVPEGDNKELCNQRENEKVVNLLQKMNQNILTNEIKLHRLGKPEMGKIRSIKIMLKDKHVAREVLRKKERRLMIMVSISKGI